MVEGTKLKNLRATIEEKEFHRFKRVKNQLGEETNDEAIIALMDIYESQKSGQADEDEV